MTGTALVVPSPASLGSLDQYIQAVNRFPLLAPEQEIELGRRLVRDNDLDAAQQLVLSHLRLVVAVSRNLRSSAAISIGYPRYCAAIQVLTSSDMTAIAAASSARIAAPSE